MKKQFKPWLYAAAVLLMSGSCEKKDPSACCGPSVGKYRYMKTIKNVGADLHLSNSFVIDTSGDGTLFICPSQREQFSTYENTYTLNQPQPFKYRIWGRVFNCDACPTIKIGLVPHIVIDKIEKVN